jgi:hypothetical protein
MSEERELPAKPIGVVASLSGGLDVVIQGWRVILIPLCLDLFLWFGPHLSIQPVVERALAELAPLLEGNPAVDVVDLVRQAASELNYFSTFSVAPLGVPSLMTVKLPQETPLGQPAVYLVGDELQWMVLFVGLFLGGLLAGGVYLGLIAQQVRDGAFSLSRLLAIVPRYWLSVLALIVALLLIGAVLGLPILLAVVLLSGLSVWIATLVVWVAFMLFLWLVFHLIFTVHGILLNYQPLHKAVWNSLRLVAFNSFSVMGLVAMFVALSAGLNFLWSLPKDDSWMLLVGIAGHAVISSGLLAATFVFYQDRYRYWQEVRAYFAREAHTDTTES